MDQPVVSGGNRKLVIALFLIAVAIVAGVYAGTHREITDPATLIARMIAASRDVRTYQFELSTQLTMPGEELELMSGRGYVDYPNRQLRTTMTAQGRSFELIVLNETVYVREAPGAWRTQHLDQETLWKSYDQLEQQYAILRNASNTTMANLDSGWVLAIVPAKQEVTDQLSRAGMETITEDELQNFTITYWIEGDSYFISRIENMISLELNIQGLVTPIQLDSYVNLTEYNKELKIAPPLL
jgi:hypothetical protein